MASRKRCGHYRRSVLASRTMIRYLVAHVATLAVFCALDFVRLGFVAKGFYQAQVGPLLRARPNWPVAVAFYAVYAAGAVFSQ
jgi:uncharacterized membrane protein